MVGLLIELISSCDSLYSYSVCQLWLQLDHNLTSKQPLVQVAMWSIGEFADLLIGCSNTEQLNNEVVGEQEIIDKCEEVLSSLQVTLISKEYTLNALIKLSVRFPEQTPRIKKIVDLFGCSHSIELQQRAVEFTTLFSKHNQLRPSVFEKMPQMVKSERKSSDTEIEAKGEETLIASNNVDSIPQSNSSALLDLLDLSPTNEVNHVEPVKPDSNSAAVSNVLDLLGILDAPVEPSLPAPVVNNPTNDLNNLDALFGGGSNTTAPVLNGNNSLLGNNILDIDPAPLDDPLKISSPPAATATSIPPLTAFEKNGLKIVFHFEKSTENQLTISLIANNNTESVIEDFLFQAAVPKVRFWLLTHQQTNPFFSVIPTSTDATFQYNHSSELQRNFKSTD